MRPLPLLSLNGCQQDVRFGKVRIEFQSFLGSVHDLLAFLLHGTTDENRAEYVMRACEANVSRCKCRILPDGLFEISNTLFDLFPVAAFDEPTLEIAFIGFRCDMTSVHKPRTFLPRNCDFDPLGNRLRYLAFQREGVPQLAVVSLRPEVLIGCAANQLGVNTDVTSLPYY